MGTVSTIGCPQVVRSQAPLRRQKRFLRRWLLPRSISATSVSTRTRPSALRAQSRRVVAPPAQPMAWGWRAL